jgi:hypothetical protein
MRNFVEVVERMIATLPAEGVTSRSVRAEWQCAIDRVNPFMAPELYWQSYSGWVDRVLERYAPRPDDVAPWLKPAIAIWTDREVSK